MDNTVPYIIIGLLAAGLIVLLITILIKEFASKETKLKLKLNKTKIKDQFTIFLIDLVECYEYHYGKLTEEQLDEFNKHKETMYDQQDV